MATFALGSNLTIAELVRREDPNGRLADIVDVLSETNDIIQDASWKECNNGTFDQVTRKASEPTGEERAYDMGVLSEAGVTEVVSEPTCMLDGLSEVDIKKVQHSPNGAAAARSQEDGFFLAGMSKTFVSRLFDGDRDDNPLRINGINNRTDYNTLASDYTFDNAGGNASATANKTSIYIIQWGPGMTNLIYPRNDAPGNSTFGISMDDYGRQMITDFASSSRKYPAYQSWFEIHFGISIEDPRTIKRVVNISTTNIDGVDDFSFDENVLIAAINQLEHSGRNAMIYMNRTMQTQFDIRANDKGNALYTMSSPGEGPFGRPVTMFRGIPIRRVDQITDAQTTVS